MGITVFSNLDGSVYAIHTFTDEYTTGGQCWIAEHPELDGCFAQGDTEVEAIRNLVEVTEMWLEHMREYNLPIPKPNSHLTRTS